MRKGKPLASRASMAHRVLTLVVVGLGHMPAGRKAPAMALPKDLPAEKVRNEIGAKIVAMDAIIAQCEVRFGRLTTVIRRCGKPHCHCAQPHDPGHGPHRQLTQKIAGKTVTQTLSSPSAVRKAEKEIAEFRRFQTLAQELVQVSQKICRLRPLAAEELSPGKKKWRKQSSRKSAEK